jgi:ferredoxin
VEANFKDDDVPEAWQGFIELNAEMVPQCPPITVKKEPLTGS